MPHRRVEAWLWGEQSEVQVSADLFIRRAVGRFGTAWEVECRSLWAFWRLPHYLAALLPREAAFDYIPQLGDDEVSGPVFSLEFWEEAPAYANSGAFRLPPISKPSDELQ